VIFYPPVPAKKPWRAFAEWRVGAGRRIAYMGIMTDHPPPERPKVEPEIIPPGQRGPHPRGANWVWTSSGRAQGRTVRFETRGPLALVMVLLMLGLGSAFVLAILLGLVLLWIPVSIAIAVAILWSFFFRGRRS
jgi:hypothetical protein